MSPRTEETNQRIREEQRERIFKAARTVFAHKGFTDTKMTDFARLGAAAPWNPASLDF